MGVMSYVAPELFHGGTYSKATDVYAFGMIMWEISAEEKPFLNIPHNSQLALQICKGLRPQITKDTPEFYCDLMQKCWNVDPEKRPTAKDIKELTSSWYEDERTQEIQDQIAKAEEIRKSLIKTRREKPQTQHPEAIYTSRSMPNVSKGKFIKFYIKVIHK